MKFDKIDLKILDVLQSDGRITKVKLAEKANLSTSACFERLCRIESSKLITRYSAEVNIQRLANADIVVVQLTLANHRQYDFMKFETYIKNVPHVVECLSMSGGYDYLLKFAVNSMMHFQEIFDEMLDSDIGIERYFSYVVIKPIVSFTGYPLPELVERARQDIGDTVFLTRQK